MDRERNLRIDIDGVGPGGQSVEHDPTPAVPSDVTETGLVVEIQDEKSQHKNKAKAISVLRSGLYDLQQQKQREANSVARRSSVRAGDRSESGPYNFPHHRPPDQEDPSTTCPDPGRWCRPHQHP